MAELSERYALPLLQAGQAQKEVTHNGAVAAIDALLHLAVEDRTSTAEPAAPASGSAWLVAATPTGSWAGRAGQIAVFDAAGWSFVVPRAGCLAYVKDEGVFAAFDGGAWHADAWPVHALTVGGRTVLAGPPPGLAPVSGGGVIDAEARTAIAAIRSALIALGLATTI